MELSGPIKISIVDAHAETRVSLAALLNRLPELRCLSHYACGEAAVQGIPFEKPDVALMDITLPGKGSLRCIAELKKRLPQLRILMLTRFEETDLIFKALQSGASGYLPKTATTHELVEMIKQLHGGGATMSVQIARKVIHYFDPAPQPESEGGRLSDREQKILALLVKGYTCKEISDQFGTSERTVNAHFQQIYDHLRAQLRMAATADGSGNAGAYFLSPV